MLIEMESQRVNSQSNPKNRNSFFNLCTYAHIGAAHTCTQNEQLQFVSIYILCSRTITRRLPPHADLLIVMLIVYCRHDIKANTDASDIPTQHKV